MRLDDDRRVLSPRHPDPGALTDDTLLARSPEVRGTDLAGLHVLSTDTTQYVGLRDVAARIWALLDEPRTVSGLVDALAAEYATEAGRVRADVWPFLEELVARGLVRTG